MILHTNAVQQPYMCNLYRDCLLLAILYYCRQSYCGYDLGLAVLPQLGVQKGRDVSMSLGAHGCTTWCTVGMEFTLAK